MAYSDFTLDRIVSDFGIDVIESRDYFADRPVVTPPDCLAQFLQINTPIAVAINTEKARSEMIIAPILLALKHWFNDQISLFSGNEFNVDSELGLTGRVDFLISQSSEQLWIKAPVLTIVEAKNENLNAGLGQCIAELIAADRFNRQRGNERSPLYGLVTTGSLWKFLEFRGDQVMIDLREYAIEPLDRLFGILVSCVEAKSQDSN